jgi:hypothetical protein
MQQQIQENKIKADFFLFVDTPDCTSEIATLATPLFLGLATKTALSCFERWTCLVVGR